MTRSIDTVTRRGALALLGAGAAAPAAAARAAPPAVAFRHGVASGDPTPNGAVLWTRATPPDGHAAPIDVAWSVAETPDGPAVERGTAQARPARDFTVKAEPKRLKPGRDYWFRFEAGGTRSPVGRFRTLPRGRTDRAVLAVVSCQLYSGGFFNAYRAIAALDRVDAVVHLGDYIYEYATKDYGAETAARLGRVPDPPHETVTLGDYRRRHAHYKLDPDLQAAHARAAFIAVWDDHEVTNDGWADGAENHQPETEGDWAARKAAAMQAYFEWMPIRDPAPGAAIEAVNRGFDFGDLATLAMVETRLLARDRQAAFKADVPAERGLAALMAERARPERELLGRAQQDWLAGELKRSASGGVPWQLVGNQTIMARVMAPDLERRLGAERFGAIMGRLRPSLQRRVARALAATRAGVPMNLDGWDGYPAARERLYASFRAAGVRPVVLTGDSHAFWANELSDAEGRAVATEFGTTSITSPSLGDALPGLGLGVHIAEANDEVEFCDQDSRGFLLLTLTRERARADLIAVSTVLDRDFTTRTVAGFELAAGRERPRLAPVAG